jgi:beta-lactamase regulating signal transducer with metallopeptidase domain
MIHYILQILVFQLLFLIAYDVFLKKELHFNWNRIYLIGTPVLSFILPLIEIDFIRKNIPEGYIIQLPAVILGGTSSEYVASETLNAIIIHGISAISTTLIFQLIWLSGALVALSFFLFKLYKVFKLKRSGTSINIDRTKIISLANTDIAFSFLNTIFIGEGLSSTQKETILLHEKVHIQQYHSFDLLFFEFIKIICWFNPLVYVYQNKMILLQEYMADEKAASLKGKNEYYNGLLSQVFKTESISFINTFFNHSLIKKRIVMLQKSNLKANKISQLKYLLLVPIIGIMLIYTSCSQETEKVQTSSVSKKIRELKTVIEHEGITEEEKQEFISFLHQLSDEDKEEMINGTYKNKEYKKEDAIPFSTIDKVPTYPGCTGDNEALKECFTQNIMQFVGAEFNTKVSNKEILGKQRIVVKFKIDNTGKVTNVQARSEFKELEGEAIRVISSLPEMLPGEHEGKKVGVQYSLPIIFDIQ